MKWKGLRGAYSMKVMSVVEAMTARESNRGRKET